MMLFIFKNNHKEIIIKNKTIYIYISTKIYLKRDSDLDNYLLKIICEQISNADCTLQWKVANTGQHEYFQGNFMNLPAR